MGKTTFVPSRLKNQEEEPEKRKIYYMRGDLMEIQKKITGDAWANYAKEKFNKGGENNTIWMCPTSAAGKETKKRKDSKGGNQPKKEKTATPSPFPAPDTPKMGKQAATPKAEGGHPKQPNKAEGGTPRASRNRTHSTSTGVSYPQSMDQVIQRAIGEMILNEDPSAKAPLVVRRNCLTVEKSLAARSSYRLSVKKAEFEKDKLLQAEETIKQLKAQKAEHPQQVQQRHQVNATSPNPFPDLQAAALPRRVPHHKQQQVNFPPMPAPASPGNMQGQQQANLPVPITDPNVNVAIMQRYMELVYQNFNNMRM